MPTTRHKTRRHAVINSAVPSSHLILLTLEVSFRAARLRQVALKLSAPFGTGAAFPPVLNKSFPYILMLYSPPLRSVF